MRATNQSGPRDVLSARGPWHRTWGRSTRQATYRIRRLPSSPDRIPLSEPRQRHATEEGLMATTKSSKRQSASITVTSEQRDALLYECDDNVGFADDKEPNPYSVRMMPVITALVDDLALSDAEGLYEISSVPRAELIQFLEHALVCALGTGMEPPFLRIWYTCMTLLADLGYEIEGSVYSGIACHCEDCARAQERFDALS
jgi:hypothetical protein